jgi:hypothetical protein
MGFEEEYEKTECCPRNYTRLYTSERKAMCGMCSRDLSNPECRPYEASEIPAWSARGPAKVKRPDPLVVNPLMTKVPGGEERLPDWPASGGRGWQKPDLVAPGTAVAANSDGNSNSAGDGEDYGVQCGMPAKAETGKFGCVIPCFLRHMLPHHFSVFLLTVFVTAGATS